jgi:hypothetical protein
VREIRTLGSVRGPARKGRSYRDTETGERWGALRRAQGERGGPRGAVPGLRWPTSSGRCGDQAGGGPGCARRRAVGPGRAGSAQRGVMPGHIRGRASGSSVSFPRRGASSGAPRVGWEGARGADSRRIEVERSGFAGSFEGFSPMKRGARHGAWSPRALPALVPEGLYSS